jgi:hypothetical protein
MLCSTGTNRRHGRYGADARLIDRRPRAARRSSAPRADRPTSRPARQFASSSSSRRSGVRGCQPLGTGWIKAPGKVSGWRRPWRRRRIGGSDTAPKSNLAPGCGGSGHPIFEAGSPPRRLYLYESGADNGHTMQLLTADRETRRWATSAAGLGASHGARGQ